MSSNPRKETNPGESTETKNETTIVSPFAATRLMDPFGSSKAAKQTAATTEQPVTTDPPAETDPSTATDDTPKPARRVNPFDSVRLLDPFAKPKVSWAERLAKKKPRPDADTDAAAASTRQIPELA